GIACPVTKEAASEQSQTTASAISSGLPARPIGWAAAMAASTLGCWRVIRLIIGVSIAPGQTTFTRMPDLAYSKAAVLVSPTTPCLLATYAPLPCAPTKPAPDAVLTIAPPPCASI